ncbi:d-lactate dehydrogenase [Anaeramoeba flamelloides]|uniref:D-lactate dehydrogenase (cytochrome) n=1 Tax=Anaeramoeba flamelloides TaxID=1746091 RepID=A0AAV8A0N8_9EUKA|nr:d-lactate dehydrogenase -related [Anaeramoeba flamelloides]KAJ6251470.1 d-lactate dehydrogenase [Anaeramoeba flamelloides]|eukprot:Anaeramoba_flamelloidesa1057162_83.p1 GENE.a1057162_83~~a1057162_83.p1  ORF type:complete len:468 (-),score=103.39 a1057162_83:65-1468(-)
MTTETKYQRKETPKIAIKELGELLGERCSLDEEDLKKHGRDKSHLDAYNPDCVVYPKTTEEVVSVVKICDKYDVIMIPYGVGTSLEGHTTPIHGGIHIDMSLMNKILHCSLEDMDVTVQSGTLKNQLNSYLSKKGVFFAVDPGSNATIGGMCSTGASGTMTVKYGTIRDNVVNLTIVLADGRILKTANRAKKSSSGYDLTHLILGSEGTLGIITEATVKIYRLPKAISSGICCFPTVKDCTEAVTKIVQTSLGSLARCEYLNTAAITGVNKYFKSTFTEKPTLLLEFHGETTKQVEQVKEKLVQIVEGHGSFGLSFTTDKEKRDKMWKIRHNVYYALINSRENCKLFASDVCVPISNLPKIILETEKEFKERGVFCPIIGHVADGNFHVNAPITDEETELVEELNENLIERAVKYEGTCSGEHGIGFGKINSSLREHGELFFEIEKKIKLAFDPKNLLNPGKVYKNL